MGTDHMYIVTLYLGYISAISAQTDTEHMYIVTREDGDLERISRQFVMESTLVFNGDLTCCRRDAAEI